MHRTESVARALYTWRMTNLGSKYFASRTYEALKIINSDIPFSFSPYSCSDDKLSCYLLLSPTVGYADSDILKGRAPLFMPFTKEFSMDLNELGNLSACCFQGMIGCGPGL